MSTQELNKLSLNTSSQLPFAIIQRKQGVLIAEYNALRMIERTDDGFTDRIVLQNDGLNGIIGATGIVGEW